jgi:hypothetical protein
LRSRLEGCREIVNRLSREGVLREGLDPDAAAELLRTITSLRTWEDLVLQRGWAASQYEQRVQRLFRPSLSSVPIPPVFN